MYYMYMYYVASRPPPRIESTNPMIMHTTAKFESSNVLFQGKPPHLCKLSYIVKIPILGLQLEIRFALYPPPLCTPHSRSSVADDYVEENKLLGQTSERLKVLSLSQDDSDEVDGEDSEKTIAHLRECVKRERDQKVRVVLSRQGCYWSTIHMCTELF